MMDISEDTLKRLKQTQKDLRRVINRLRKDNALIALPLEGGGWEKRPLQPLYHDMVNASFALYCFLNRVGVKS